MTIQLPILLWTVINFVLLIFLLNRLLFRPMLAFMDQRQARIDAAAAKKAERERALAEREAQLEECRRDEAKQLSELMSREIAAAKHDAQTLLAVTHKKQTQALDLALAELDSESKQIEETLDKSVGALAEAWSAPLVS